MCVEPFSWRLSSQRGVGRYVLKKNQESCSAVQATSYVYFMGAPQRFADSYTPVMTAAREGQAECLNFLFTKGADQNNTGKVCICLDGCLRLRHVYR